MLNIDQLKYNWKKPFLDLMEGMERKVHPVVIASTVNLSQNFIRTTEQNFLKIIIYIYRINYLLLWN